MTRPRRPRIIPSIGRDAHEKAPPIEPDRPTRNLKLTIEYDGTNYAGWQAQENALSVQTVLEGALERIVGERTRIAGAGRTDAGVHAAGQAASFRTSSPVPPRGLLGGLNALLPGDIAVLSAEEVPPEFHARFSAKSRTYRYSILNREAPSALRGRFVWHYKRELSAETWNALAAQLIGQRDFSSFQKAGSSRVSPVCRVTECFCERDGDLLTLTITADSFLRGMARGIVGTFQRLAPDSPADADAAIRELRRILDARDRSAAGAAAPAAGLCLMKVTY